MRCFKLLGLVALPFLCLPLGVYAAGAASFALSSVAEQFPARGLESRIDFWKAVYAKYDRRQVVLHDRRNLAIVYKVLEFDADPDASKEEAKRQKAEVGRIAALIVTALEDYAAHGQIAAGYSPTHKEVYDAFRRAGADMTPSALRTAAAQVRDQRGVKQRFEVGLKRSGLYLSHIQEIFRRKGLPVELSYLPHVESSFDYGAYSKVGAAGIWQFMRGTARGLLRMNSLMDERRDPIRATEAAASVLARNYQLLGSWPLAITAYNHGTNGMLRAKKAIGQDYLAILDRYDGRLFGFASQNFYSEFLAALEVARNHTFYFPESQTVDPLLFQSVKLKGEREHARKLAQISPDVLRAYNPGILVDIHSNLQRLPAGYTLRIPPGDPDPLLATMTPRRHPQAVQSRPAPQVRSASAASTARQYKVRRGDTLSKIASVFGVSMQALKAKNKALQAGRVFAGQIILLP